MQSCERKKKKRQNSHWEWGREQREQMKLCTKATVELAQSIPQRTSKAEPCCNSVQLRNTRLLSVCEAFPAQGREVLVADESRNKGPGRTSCFRGKGKGCPWQAKDMTVLQTDWGHSVPLPSSQGPPNLPESLAHTARKPSRSAHEQLHNQCGHSDSKPHQTVKIKHTASCASSSEITHAQQCSAKALHHLLLH